MTSGNDSDRPPNGGAAHGAKPDAGPPRKTPLDEDFHVEIQSGSRDLWKRIGSDILEIERSAYEDPNEWLPSEVLEADVSDPTTIVALLRRRNAIVGFTYLEIPSRLSRERAHEDADVRHVSDTAIRPDAQGAGLVGRLMNAVEIALRAGGFRFLTRNAKISRGYADKIERHYGDRIVEKFDHPSPWGPQRWFKIRL